MPISQQEFMQILARGPEGWTVVSGNPRTGTENTYDGRDLTAFLERRDQRNHSHIVKDSAGRVVYRRDHRGAVYVDDRNPELVEIKKALGKSMMRGATAGDIVRESFAGAMRWWTSPYKRR